MSKDKDLIMEAVRLVKNFNHALCTGIILAVAANILPAWCIERIEPVGVLHHE